MKLNVWLVSDPKDNPQWMAIINNATAAFKAKTGADINIQWQTWGNHLTNLDAALSGSGDNVPDVIEFGNTEAAKYAFNGALADVSSVKSTFDNNATWLTGLSAPCTQDGHLYCIPYYAGTRTLIYRTDLLTAAGVTAPPKTWADFTAALDKVKAANASNPNFVTYNTPGQGLVPGRLLHLRPGRLAGRQGLGRQVEGQPGGPQVRRRPAAVVRPGLQVLHRGQPHQGRVRPGHPVRDRQRLRRVRLGLALRRRAAGAPEPERPQVAAAGHQGEGQGRHHAAAGRDR